MSQDPKTRYLSLYLLREGITDYEAALKEPKSVERYPLSESLDFSGELFLKMREPTPAWWPPFVQPGLEASLPDQFNASTAAVLLMRVGERIVAITFGHGRHLLNEEAYERDFGLKAALSMVEPSSLRSIDSRTVEDMTLQRRAQASRGTEWPAFGLDITRDLMSAVTGEARPGSFISRVTGKDVLSVSAKVTVDQLGDLAREVFTAYESGEYRKNFEWIDHLRQVRSPSDAADLDKLLVATLRQNELDLIHMAPPETVDWERIEGFFFTRSTSEPRHDYLSIHEYIDVVGDSQAITLDKLKRDRVRVQYANMSNPMSEWSIYSCLIAEIRAGEATYVLSGGDYYEADQAFVDQVDSHLRTLKIATLPFPAHVAGQWESKYNENAAKALGAALLDRKLIKLRDGDSPIEPCDLFTKDREFIHVKRSSASSNLSHLFAQGLVSAQSLFDPDFRSELHDRIEQLDSSLARLVPVTEMPSPTDYTILYGIITRESPDWPCSLPFFSRVHLSTVARDLSNLGYMVATQCIPRA